MNLTRTAPYVFVITANLLQSLAYECHQVSFKNYSNKVSQSKIYPKSF